MTVNLLFPSDVHFSSGSNVTNSWLVDILCAFLGTERHVCEPLTTYCISHHRNVSFLSQHSLEDHCSDYGHSPRHRQQGCSTISTTHSINKSSGNFIHTEAHVPHDLVTMWTQLDSTILWTPQHPSQVIVDSFTASMMGLYHVPQVWSGGNNIFVPTRRTSAHLPTAQTEESIKDIWLRCVNTMI